MNNRGLIITNAFSYRESAKYQCESLKKEFTLLGIELVHKTNEELLTLINGQNVECKFDLSTFDFVIYLDKDKYISLMLEKSHLKLFNSSFSIELCDDKMLTHIFLANNGIKMPKTLTYPLCYEYNGSLNYLNDIKKELTFPFVIKENFGSLGQQVYLVANDEELLNIENKLRYKPHIYQEYISYEEGIDYRLILIGENVVASMKRVNNNSFKANIAQGGKGYNFEPSEKMKKMAIDASKVLGLDYCAIDFVINSDGEPILIEVNSNAYFTEIEKVTGVNIAKLYANYVRSKLQVKTSKF
jgi:RimK family alpha-L-glutamate ligase